MQFEKTKFTPQEREEFIYETLKHKVYKFLMVRNFNETDFFDLGHFFKKYNVKNQSETEKYIDRLLDEIRLGGWNCGTSFYRTGLFIFGDVSPPTFFPDTNEF